MIIRTGAWLSPIHQPMTLQCAGGSGAGSVPAPQSHKVKTVLARSSVLTGSRPAGSAHAQPLPGAHGSLVSRADRSPARSSLRTGPWSAGQACSQCLARSPPSAAANVPDARTLVAKLLLNGRRPSGQSPQANMAVSTASLPACLSAYRQAASSTAGGPAWLSPKRTWQPGPPVSRRA
jgi:hypothetical protein